jgi:hypothetical protein
MVRVGNTQMHDIVMSFIPKKNGSAVDAHPPPPIFKGSIPTLKPQGEALVKPISAKTSFESAVAFEQPKIVVEKVVNAAPEVKAAEKVVVKAAPEVKAAEKVVVNEIKSNSTTKEPVEKNNSLERIDVENIKSLKKKKQISATKTLIENIIDQKLRKSYINNIISKTNTVQSQLNKPSNAVQNRSRNLNNLRKYNQHFLTTKMFDVEPPKTEKSFRDVVFKIDGKERKHSRRRNKSRNGKKSRDKKQKNNSTIKIKQSAPVHLRNDLEKIIDGVTVA